MSKESFLKEFAEFLKKHNAEISIGNAGTRLYENDYRIFIHADNNLVMDGFKFIDDESVVSLLKHRIIE